MNRNIFNVETGKKFQLLDSKVIVNSTLIEGILMLTLKIKRVFTICFENNEIIQSS